MNRSSSGRLSRSTQVAFGVIIVFLVAQVAWWLWFQNDYLGAVTAAREAAWHDDAKLANEILALNPTRSTDLLADHPHLMLDGGLFVVDPAQIAAFESRQDSHLRMFLFEGVFFVIVVLAGLLVLARSLLLARGLEQRQRNFLLAVTHELRTPLSTLRLLIETLQYRPPASEKLDDYLVRMDGELTRLERSSEMVLASARLEQAQEARELRPTDLNTAVGEVLEKHRTGLETRGAVLEFEPASRGLLVDLESAAFETLLTNLLDNAVKYSPDPVKPVRVRLERSEHGARLSVADEGVGVEAEESGKIFERFYRPGSEMTRNSQGVGLGLHLVRMIVNFLGGKVWHEPNAAVGKGSRFVITLPLSRSSETESLDLAARPGRKPSAAANGGEAG